MGRFISQGRPPINYEPRPEGQHGTYDTQGRWHPQVVRLGRTLGGTPGLFSSGMLAWPVNDAEYAALRAMPTRELRAYVNAKGFELEPRTAD